MRKNPALFTMEEYQFLHQVFLRIPEDAKMYRKIKMKHGAGLDKSEIQYIKRRFQKWRETQDNTVFLPDGELEDSSIIISEQYQS